MTPFTFEDLERLGYTLILMGVVVIPIVWALARRIVSQLGDRDQALKEQRQAHNKERETLMAMYGSQIAEERVYSAQKDARNSVLNDRIYDMGKEQVVQAKEYAAATIESVNSIRSEMQAELVSLGARMRAAESIAEKAQREALDAKSRDEECRRRLNDLEKRIDTQARHTVIG